MTHSDMENSGLSSLELSELAAALGAGEDDAIVVLWASDEDAATAAREVIFRAREALEGIPSETRQAYDDGTTGFERILPGPDRMYPDTDTPPLAIPDSTIAEVRARMPETPWARQDRYQELGLDRRTAGGLAVAPWADLFDELAPRAGDPARRLATVLEKRIPHHLRRGRGSKGRLPDEMPEASRLAPAVRALEAGTLRPEALARVVDEVLGFAGRPAEEVLGAYRPGSDAETLLEGVVSNVAARAGTLEGRPPDRLLRWAMGEAMRELLGRVDPGRVLEGLAAALGSAGAGLPGSRGEPASAAAAEGEEAPS
jgi:glutamyl-tRNA(Gln) amidotransferase subunit E